MQLTKNNVYKILQQVFETKVLLIVGTGVSCAVDSRFGMSALKQQLLKEVPQKISNKKDAKLLWEDIIKKSSNGDSLENALREIQNEDLVNTIVEVTGCFLSQLDKEYNLKIWNNEIEVPFEIFLSKLFNGLPQSNPELNIITSNYDLIIEHCCDKNKILYCNGFVGGIQKYYNWNQAIKEMYFTERIQKRKKKEKIEWLKKHVKLHKVHGSINYFKKDFDIFEDNSIIYENNLNFERLIITPGDSKYRKAWLTTRDFIEHADDAILKEEAYVFVGYGFNDIHIEQKIKRELIENKKSGIIITMDLSDNAKQLIAQSKNLWAVYRDSKNNNTSLVLNQAFKEPLILNNCNIWKINEFTREVLGD